MAAQQREIACVQRQKPAMFAQMPLLGLQEFLGINALK
jgi:hypothetical protein